MATPAEVVIVGGGIAGSALATVLARAGRSVAVLERDTEPVDRVRGEYVTPWGVAELERLGLLEALVSAGGVFVSRNVPYDENTPGDAALPLAIEFSKVFPGSPGALCMGHPAMCEALATAAQQAGAIYKRRIAEVEVTAGKPPGIAFSEGGRRIEWHPRLVVGADGRNSVVRRQLAFPTLADPPHNLLGGMLVEGVERWPADTQAIGTEGRSHFLVFPQGNGRLRLYLCYDFDDKAPYAGSDRQRNLLATFAGLRCLPLAADIAAARPIGPFNSFSNEDRWIEDPKSPGVVLIGDAAGHNDPILGQGIAIAARDVRLVSEILLAGTSEPTDFRPYVEERNERLRRLRVVARMSQRLRAEFGEEARRRRARAAHRVRVEKMLTRALATLVGPERVPAAAFEPATIDALLA